MTESVALPGLSSKLSPVCVLPFLWPMMTLNYEAELVRFLLVKVESCLELWESPIPSNTITKMEPSLLGVPMCFS